MIFKILPFGSKGALRLAGPDKGVSWFDNYKSNQSVQFRHLMSGKNRTFSSGVFVLLSQQISSHDFALFSVLSQVGKPPLNVSLNAYADVGGLFDPDVGRQRD